MALSGVNLIWIELMRQLQTRFFSQAGVWFALVLLQFSALALYSPIIGAADRALLIGVGRYQHDEYNLEGIDTDLFAMQRMVRQLGYNEDDIMVLRDSEVTRLNVESAFRDFLARDASPDDRVIVYYTGHGTQVEDTNNDEPDARDEALSLYSLNATRNGWSGVLVDDEIESLIDELPSRNVTVIVDACHSGSVNRGLSETVALQTRAYGDTVFTVKALPYRGGNPAPVSQQQPQQSQTKSARINPVPLSGKKEGVVILSAVRDEQKALATPRGSAFTLALYEAMQGPLGSDTGAITPNALLSETRRLIARKVGFQERYAPALGGDTTRFDQSLTLRTTVASKTRPAPSDSSADTVAVESRQRPRAGHRQHLESELQKFERLNLMLAQNTYLPGDAVSFRVTLPQAGFLNVVAVDQDDVVTVLFPNEYQPQNRFAEGDHELPGQLAFEWLAMAPAGETLLAAVYSQEPLNWYYSSLDVGFDGQVLRGFAAPGPNDLLLNKQSQSIRAGWEVFTVCDEGEECP